MARYTPANTDTATAVVEPTKAQPKTKSAPGKVSLAGLKKKATGASKDGLPDLAGPGR